MVIRVERALLPALLRAFDVNEVETVTDFMLCKGAQAFGSQDKQECWPTFQPNTICIDTVRLR
jgi:hypothetical protein